MDESQILSVFPDAEEASRSRDERLESLKGDVEGSAARLAEAHLVAFNKDDSPFAPPSSRAAGGITRAGKYAVACRSDRLLAIFFQLLAKNAALQAFTAGVESRAFNQWLGEASRFSKLSQDSDDRASSMVRYSLQSVELDVLINLFSDAVKVFHAERSHAEASQDGVGGGNLRLTGEFVPLLGEPATDVRDLSPGTK